MGELVGTQLVLWVGVALVALTLAQAAFSLFSSFRRNRLATAQQELSIRSLNSDVERKTLHKNFEAEKLTNVWSGFRKFRVDRKVPEGGGICSFYLVPHDGKGLPPFEPGQYLTFDFKVPNQTKAVVRCYSLSDSPQKSSEYYRISVKHALPPPKVPDAPPGVSSSFLHGTVEEGDIIDTRAPGGNFFMEQASHTPVVLIGGGVGITPVLSMMNCIIEAGSKREAHFFYGVRHGEEHIMREYLDDVAATHENIHLHVCYSDPRDGIDVEGRDYQHAGRVSVDLFKKVLPSNNFDYYMCGPPPMMESLVNDLGDWGVPEKHIHLEAFGPASVKKKPAPAAAPAEAGAEAISIEFAKTGKTCDWSPDQGTILDFAEEQGIAMDFGCRAGSCGTCKTAVRSGKVDYLDPPGSPIEDGSCLPCIAVPKSSISIDA